MNMTTNKRSDYLKKISWEHHQALRYALHLKKGLANGADGSVLAAYVKVVTEKHLVPHFSEEEQALFSRLDSRQQENDALRQVLREHRELPALAVEISGNRGNDRAQIQQFAEAIVSHVKLEEKTLFPYIERVLSERALTEAQAQIEQMHSSEELDWADEFWKQQ